MDYTSTALIHRVKRISGNAPGLSTSDYLEYINSEVRSVFVPLMMSLDKTFFQESVDVTISSSGTLIPSRAIGSTVLDVAWVDSGDTSELPYVERLGPSSRSPGWYLKRNRVMYVNVTGTARISYNVMPSELVEVSRCGVVSVSGTTYYTVTSVPSVIVTGSVCDVVQGKPQFDALAKDKTVSNVAGTNIYFSALPSSDVVAGDYVCLAGESPVLQVPEVAHDLIVHGAALRIATANAHPSVQVIAQRYGEIRQMVVKAMGGRTKGSPRIIKPCDDFFVSI